MGFSSRHRDKVLAAKDVLPVSYRFQMDGVAAQAVSAKMVEFEALRHRPDGKFVRRSVGEKLSSVWCLRPDLAVAVLIRDADPVVAAGGGVFGDPARKPLGKRSPGRAHRGTT